MSLTPEWRHRLENWREELRRHFYRPLGPVPLEGFVTLEQLALEQALARNFTPMPPGTPWGAKWEYGWFRGAVTLPGEAAGQQMVLRLDPGAESAVFLHGALAGAIDIWHKEMLLAESGVPGKRYEFALEAYAGHGPMVTSGGPNPPGRLTVPEPPAAQCVVGESSLGIWQEDVYQLWLDVETLFDIRENIEADSLRAAEIDQALRDFTIVVDFELPLEGFLDSVRACRERLAPLLACRNGSTTPKMFAFGHAHIDTAWLWPLQETERKCARTFSTALALMDRYPEYKFLQSQPHLYWMMKHRYPDLYRRIQEAVRRGQWIAEGAVWVEPDTNVPSGESLIRQFVHGKRFFRDEFGVECELLWLPDVFGYSGALPQIMRGCGIRYFSTHKIFWAYNGGDPFPYNTFIWEGIDGSEVKAHFHTDYNSTTNPATIIQRWNQRAQKDGIATRLLPFGWGDGGGGPTRDHLEFARRQPDLEGSPQVAITSPLDFFHDQEARGWPRARYIGELYFQNHRGTYTSQARSKRLNRLCELALREAEVWASAAVRLHGWSFPAQASEAAWRNVLLNQFHDILPGSSIHRVYEEAEASYAESLKTARSISQAAAAALVEPGDNLTVFNSLGWPRTVLVALPEGMAGASAPDGNALPVQSTAGQTWVEAPVPALGWRTLQPAAPVETPNTLHATPTRLENELLRADFNERGEIVRLFDKTAQREVSAGVCNQIKMYRDVVTNWDAWDLDSMYEQTPVDLPEPARVEVIASGPLFARLRLTRRINQSTLTQEITLRGGSRRLDFHTVVDWQESHKLLKVNFPVTVHANEALHEIQFGYIARPNHASRPFDADRFEVSAHKWTALVEGGRGCAVLNDCKYGVNVLGNSINLTLLKSALAPDMTADKGRQEFTYSFYFWNGPFVESGLVREGFDLNVPPLVAAGQAAEASLFGVDAANVVIDTVKPAEDGSGDIIVRLYEAMHTATRCQLTISLPVSQAMQADMLENAQDVLSIRGNTVTLDFRPFEVKTLRLR